MTHTPQSDAPSQPLGVHVYLDRRTLPERCECGGRLRYEFGPGDYMSVYCESCTPVVEVSIKSNRQPRAPEPSPGALREALASAAVVLEVLGAERDAGAQWYQTWLAPEFRRCIDNAIAQMRNAARALAAPAASEPSVVPEREPDANERLYKLFKRCSWSSDVMMCRGCNRSIHVSRANEQLQSHAAGCVYTGEPNPWAEMRACIGTPAPSTRPAEPDAERRRWMLALSEAVHEGKLTTSQEACVLAHVNGYVEDDPRASVLDEAFYFDCRSRLDHSRPADGTEPREPEWKRCGCGHPLMSACDEIAEDEREVENG